MKISSSKLKICEGISIIIRKSLREIFFSTILKVKHKDFKSSFIKIVNKYSKLLNYFLNKKSHSSKIF